MINPYDTNVGWEDFASVEHIIPKGAGGCDHLDNFITACASCNGQRKNEALVLE